MIIPRIGRQTSARVALAFALAFGLAAGLAAPPPAVAETTDDGAIVEDAGASLSLIAGEHGVIRPGAATIATATIENRSDEAVEAGRVTVELGDTALADDTALAAWLNSGEASGTFTPLGTEQASAVPASESASVSINAAAGTISALAPGVYPLRATLTGTPAPLTAITVLIIAADSSRPITIFVPITATPEDGSLLTAEELTTLTAEDGALTAQLDAVSGTPAILAVDPLIPAAIRALGTAAPVSATDWLTRLDTLPNERFALQPGDADAVVQARLALPTPLAPLPLESLLNPASFTPTETTPSPTPTATPTDVVLPSTDELLAVPDAQPGILWPAADAQPADLATFDTYLGTAATTILPSSALSANGSSLVNVQGHRVIAVDAAASAALSNAAGADDDLTRETELAAGLAQLSYRETAQVIGLDRDETRSAESLRATILALSTIGQATPLAALSAGAPSASDILADDGATERADSLRALLDDEERLTAFSTILDDPLVLLAPERIKIMRVIGAGAASDFTANVAEHRAETMTTMDAVGVQQPSPIQLFTSAAPLPVWVRNDLPWPVSLTLTATPSDARLDIAPWQDIIAQPQSNTRVKVGVSARVGSGELDVEFGLFSPTGIQIGPAQTAPVTVRAEWEGIGLGILGGLIVLLITLGIVRTVRRRRREAATDAPEQV